MRLARRQFAGAVIAGLTVPGWIVRFESSAAAEETPKFKLEKVRGRVVFQNAALAEEKRGRDPFPDFDRAIADFNDALRRDPKLYLPLRNRGLAWQKMAFAKAGRGLDAAELYARAAEDHSQLLSRNPRDAHVLCDRGWVREKQGRPAEALADYEAARVLLGDSDAWLNDSLARVRASLRESAPRKPEY